MEQVSPENIKLGYDSYFPQSDKSFSSENSRLYYPECSWSCYNRISYERVWCILVFCAIRRASNSSISL